MLFQFVLNNADHRLAFMRLSTFHFVLGIVTKHLKKSSEKLRLTFIEGWDVRDLEAVTDHLADHQRILLGDLIHAYM